MATKTVTFPYTHFPPEVLIQVYDQMADDDVAPGSVPDRDYLRYATSLSVTTGDRTWHFDSLHEFLAELRQPHEESTASLNTGLYAVKVHEWTSSTRVSVGGLAGGGSRSTIERIMGIFEAEAANYRAEPPTPPAQPKPTVFIGHGRSAQWMSLKTYLQDQMGIRVEAYETGSRAGHTIRDVLGSMIRSTAFALLVMTGEDEQSDGQMRPRQNVVHEAGLFQGALGFERALVLLEEGVEQFSNLAGIQYVSFRKEHIRDAYGDVLAALKREFPGTS